MKEWRTEAIKDCIFDEQEQAIRAISLSKIGGKDRIVWPYTENGVYMVKIGYHVIKNEEGWGMSDKSSSSHNENNEVWKSIWKMPVPNKVKNFMWKACKNILATNETCGRNG